MMDPQDFAGKRLERLQAADDELREFVKDALSAWDGEGEFHSAALEEAVEVIWLEHFSAEAPRADYERFLPRFRKVLTDSLSKTSAPAEDPPLEYEVERITAFLGTLAVNDGTMRGAGARGVRFKRWTSMHDPSVRHAHTVVDGQTRPMSEPFEVEGVELQYPGQPVGDPSVWINCRCVVQPAAVRGDANVSDTTMTLSDDFDSRSKSLTAAGDGEEERTGVGIFLIPAENDPIVAASSEQAHMTTIWMGPKDDLAVDLEELEQAVRFYAQDLDGPVVVPVKERGTLGDEGADVVFLEPTDALVALHDGFLVNEPIKTAHDAVDQYDPWTPHVTLGYPETPAAGEYDGDAVTFDRVGLWIGTEQYTYPMGEGMNEGLAAGGILTGENKVLVGDQEGPPEYIVPLSSDLGQQLAAAKEKFVRLAAAGEVDPKIDPDVDKIEPVVDEIDDDVDEMPVDELEEGEEELLEIPVHGVATLEGRATGDGRGFREGALSIGAMPQPLGYEYVSTHGGDTSHVAIVGRIDEFFRVPAPQYGEGVFEIRWRGAIMPGKEYGSQAIESIIDGSYTGLSVIVDSVTVDVEEEREELRQRLIAERTAEFAGDVAEGAEPEKRGPMTDDEIEDIIDQFVGDGTQRTTWFSEGRIRRFDMVPTGAFQEGYTALGHEFADEMTPEAIEAAAVALQDCNCGMAIVASAAGEPVIIDLTVMSDDQRAEYDALETEEGRSAYAEQVGAVIASAFAPGTKDGPGWITHPTATARIRRYWVRGKGAGKIRWGTPGDFNRCRMQLAKYVQKPEWLAGLCANMHKEAIGVWPGQEGGKHGHGLVASAAPGELFSIVASAAPLDASYFKRRELENPRVGIVVDGDAVYGYVAQWNVCHVGINDSCTMAPRSPSNYGQFRTGTVNTTEGLVAVGQITMSTGHAGGALGARATVAHYDNTGTAAADIATGEDGFGIWFAGRIRPHLSEEDRFAMQASGRLSGDWRTIGGQYELVAALVVNVPGFPIPDVSITASAEYGPTSLIAAGIIRPEDIDVPLTAEVTVLEGMNALSADDIAGIAIAAAERVFDMQKRQEIIDRVTPARAALASLTLAAARAELATITTKD